MNDEDQISFETLEHRAAQAEEKAIHAKKKVQATFATIASAALDALGERAMTVYGLSLMAGAFSWSLFDPSILRLASATVFSLMVIYAGIFKKSDDDAS